MSDTNRPYGDDDGTQERAQKFIAGIPYGHTHSVAGCRACAGEMAEIARLRVIERAARSLLSRDDFWRAAAMLVTLPGEIDNLADALRRPSASGGDEEAT